MNPASKPENIPTPEIAEAPPKWRFRLNPAQCALGSFALACLAGAAVVMWPQAAGAGGLALLISITVIGTILLLSLISGRLTPADAPARLFGAALDVDPKPCSITANDGSIAYANPAWRRMFGRSPAGGEVLPVAGFAGDAETSQRLYQLVRAAGLKEAREEELKLKGIGGKWVHVAATPISPQGHTIWRITEASPRRPLMQGAEGQKHSVVVQFRPMEASRQAMLPLIDGGPRIPRFFQDAPVGVALIDGAGKIFEANVAFGVITGADPKRAWEKPLFDLLRDQSAQETPASYTPRQAQHPAP